MTSTGLDRFVAADYAYFKGQSIGVVCNQASVDHRLAHILDHLKAAEAGGILKVKAIFGPQHGLFGHTQDNMIEWQGDAAAPIPIHSLYGEHREPTDAMLEGLDRLVIDLPDVGARYYTFIWTMYLCMKACARKGISVTVLDRPNPIGGIAVEGPVLQPEFASFVGLRPLPIRHGMTIGEIAMYFVHTDFPKLHLNVIAMDGWSRDMLWTDTGLPWVMPSPNMPTADTALVYPGQCLLEGTNISEGRGTTRPFEQFGAPWIDSRRLCEVLNDLRLPGALFRPIQFQPTFQKHAGQLCEGAFIHVLDPHSYKPVLTTTAILQEILRHSPQGLNAPRPQGPNADRLTPNPQGFRWNPPPYEYEYVKPPIDILAGNAWLAEAIEDLQPLTAVEEQMNAECESFASARAAALQYP